MSDNDIVFTAYCKERDITYTLSEGTPLTRGRQHIISRRPDMEKKIEAVKHAVENIDIAYLDSGHGEPDKEKIYCLGADKERPHMYMKVIVEYGSENTGTIVTAWPQKTISPGEGVINYVKSKR